MFFNRLGNKKAIKELEKVQKKLKEVTDTLHHLQAGLCAASVDDTTQIHVEMFDYCGGEKMRKGTIYTDSRQFTWQEFPTVKTSFLLDYHDWYKLQNSPHWGEIKKFLNQVESKHNQTSQIEPKDLVEVLRNTDPMNM
jgi:hypothetical protein